MHDNDVDAEIYSRIVTPYAADAFETNLRELGIEDEFPHLVRNLREGFPIGDMPILDRTIIIPNHSSVDAHEDVVQAYVDKELAANRISGPFSEEETERILGGAFVSSPLLVSENEQGPGKPPKYRVCRNLSKESKKDGFPDINSFVEKESFPTSFDSAYKMGDTVANAPPGTTACAFDIESFHRTIPVHPSHKRYLVFKFKGRYYIDHCHPFGLASASSNAGQVGSAISRIWTLRLARKGNEVAPSPFRPHVPAEQRLVAWTTPHGLSAWGGSDFIPAAHKARVMVGMAEGLAKNSRSTYAAGLLRFAQYCDDIGVPEERRMPADALLLACWIAHSIGTHGRKSAKGWLDGVAYWHALNLAPWSGDDECVKKVLRAVDKEGRFTRPPRGPVTVEHLRALRATMDTSTPRASENSLSLNSTVSMRLMMFRVLLPCPVLSQPTDASFPFIFRGTKTTGSKGGTLILTETFDDLCPVTALENHLAVNHSPPPDTPLFAYCVDGSWTPTVKASFLDFFSDIVRAAGLDKVLGHSFRIGGSVFLLCSGVEPEIVMKIGGWSSTCFLIYWRRLETVIPVALARAWDKLQKAFQKTHKIPDDVANEVVFMRPGVGCPTPQASAGRVPLAFSRSFWSAAPFGGPSSAFGFGILPSLASRCPGRVPALGALPFSLHARECVGPSCDAAGGRARHIPRPGFSRLRATAYVAHL
ncbi:hypothetical protein MKEN_01357500 [Mycena kentingensis (nom. inval.)]|nr:hypothetical protein MKEN_01357500 [Mycena kentingensis (nom. inval.)]